MTTEAPEAPPSLESEPAPLELREEKDIRLKHILVLEHTQARAKMDDTIVQEYATDMEAGEKFPMIHLVKIVDSPDKEMLGKYVVVDGFHRLAAMQLLKKKKCNAYVCDGSMSDAIHMATGANIGHGLRRSNDDKRRAVIMAINLDKAMKRVRTDREIAQHCGVHHDTVNVIRHEIEGTQPKARKPKTTKASSGGGGDATEPDEDYKVNNPVEDPESLEVGMLDEEGILIESPEVLAALRRRGDFDRILDDIQSARREVKKLADESVGAELQAQQVDFDLKGAEATVKFARPYTTCPYGTECTKTCKACKGRHWITKRIWDALENDVKVAAHKRSGEAYAKLQSEAGPPPEVSAAA